MTEDKKERRPIPNSVEIAMYFHCSLCVAEGQPFQALEAGFTRLGIQVVCKRHQINIVHVDFEGQTHPANTTAPNKGALN